jgi:hypothetical protein
MFCGTCAHNAGLNPAEDAETAAARKRMSELEDSSISHCPIPPPIWARLTTETQTVLSLPPLQDGLLLSFDLGEHPRCKCGAIASSGPVTERDCMIFATFAVVRARIETRKCPRCPPGAHRAVGPDLGHLALFNYNNRLIFSHELMNEYSNRFISSETSFVGFVSSMNRRYLQLGMDTSLPRYDCFCACWFSFIRIQAFDCDFICPECGANPKTVQPDGISGGYSKAAVTKLTPPTVPCDDSPVYKDVHPPRHTQLVTEYALRRTSIALLASRVTRPTAHDVEDVVENGPATSDRLRFVHADLGEMFYCWVVQPAALSDDTQERELYQTLLRVVSGKQGKQPFALWANGGFLVTRSRIRITLCAAAIMEAIHCLF